jgi:hypothetical protein
MFEALNLYFEEIKSLDLAIFINTIDTSDLIVLINENKYYLLFANFLNETNNILKIIELIKAVGSKKLLEFITHKGVVNKYLVFALINEVDISKVSKLINETDMSKLITLISNSKEILELINKV